MAVVTTLAAYRDDHGNEVVATAADPKTVRVLFRGSNNRLVVDDAAKLDRLDVVFDCDNGSVEIGSSRRVPSLSVSIRVGQDSAVRIGRNVSSTQIVAISATEGTSVDIGNDVMFASNNEVLADDAHPIFHVRTGRRANVSRSIVIGHHVWLAKRAVVLAGGGMGDGSVLGYGAVLTRRVPNNCIAAGVPARVIRRDIAWERPHLSLKEPYYKPDASTVTKSRYWHLTEDDRRRRRLSRALRRHPVGKFAVRVRNVVRRR